MEHLNVHRVVLVDMLNGEATCSFRKRLIYRTRIMPCGSLQCNDSKLT